MIGVQGILLSRSDSWSAGKSKTVKSGDGGIEFTCTITRSSTAAATSTPEISDKNSKSTRAHLPDPRQQVRRPCKTLKHSSGIISISITTVRDYDYNWSVLTNGLEKNAPVDTTNMPPFGTKSTGSTSTALVFTNTPHHRQNARSASHFMSTHRVKQSA